MGSRLTGRPRLRAAQRRTLSTGECAGPARRCAKETTAPRSGSAKGHLAVFARPPTHVVRQADRALHRVAVAEIRFLQTQGNDVHVSLAERFPWEATSFAPFIERLK
jgi:hypothetical protein